MADKKVKAWAVVRNNGEVIETYCNVGAPFVRSVARSITRDELSLGRSGTYKAVPCTITLHMPKKKGAERGV
jgi:hypothetical protein